VSLVFGEIAVLAIGAYTQKMVVAKVDSVGGWVNQLVKF
jgi:hypothetical protein